MLDSHFTDTATIARRSVLGNKTTYATVGDPFACHIQPIDDTFATGEMGRGGKAYRLFSLAEVRIGDRLTDQNDKLYEVYGVKHHTFRARSHYEGTLRSV
ncbi:hypothetical protein [Tsuneonella sp. HG222]